MPIQSNRLLGQACALAAFGLLAACGGSHGDAPRISDGGGDGGNEALVATPKTALTLEQAPSCSVFEDYVSDSLADLVLDVGLVPCPGCFGFLTETLEPGGVTDTASAAGFSDFTGTNNQEAGVDELDQIEADANGNFYLIDGDHLVVANGLPPADLREIANLAIDSGSKAEGLLLDDDNDRLVVALSQQYGYTLSDPTFAPPDPYYPVTELLFVDVANPANPVVDRRLKIEGYRLAMRRIGSRVHLVSHWIPLLPTPIAEDPVLADLVQRYQDEKSSNSGDADQTADEIRARIATLVATTQVDEVLPGLMLQDGAQGYVDISASDCTDVALPEVSLRLALTSVTSVDSDGTDADSLTFVNDSWNVYASADHLYLSQLSSGWWWRDRQRQQTAIYKIGIGPASPQYLATGLVDGWAGSTFQFGEHDGFLRVVTSRAEFDPAVDAWRRDNNLYVLGDDNAGSLDVVGAVEGFGANESIFATRFLGDRAFVVTFRQIDPLFAFDLSIPQDPRLVGEVEIPGASTYIHPLDDTHLLTIAFDGGNNTLSGGFQLQIFDVQNLDDPRLVHRYAPTLDADGFAWTQATYDHLAFNYFPAAGTVTVPLQYYASSYDQQFSGFIAFSVSATDGFAELGRIDHSDLARETYCVDSTGSVPPACSDGRYLEAANPRRSVSALYAGDTYIYTLSNVGMKVSNAADFGNAVGVLRLPYRNEYPWVIAY